MRLDTVEIFSDATNAAIMRHPGRKFPGMLIQGDTLYSLCQKADHMCEQIGRGASGFAEANEIRNSLWEFLAHYKNVLGEHKIPLSFFEQQ